MATATRTRRRAAVDDGGIKDEAFPGMPQDPAPAKRGPGRPAGSTTKKRAAPAVSGELTKAQIKSKVSIELYAFARMFVEMWEIRDPHCAAPWLEVTDTPRGQQERLAAIVDSTVNLLSRNDAVLSFMATSGVIGEALMLGSLLLKPVKTIVKAHGPGGMGHGIEEGTDDDYSARYPAPALAH
jgi:hypothetical protein